MKQWGTESCTKAEAGTAAGRRRGGSWKHQDGRAESLGWLGTVHQACWAVAYFAPLFLKENVIEISASTHASNTLHLLEARAGIWQSLQCWESRTGKEAAAFVVISSQNNLFEL